MSRVPHGGLCHGWRFLTLFLGMWIATAVAFALLCLLVHWSASIVAVVAWILSPLTGIVFFFVTHGIVDKWRQKNKKQSTND